MTNRPAAGVLSAEDAATKVLEAIDAQDTVPAPGSETPEPGPPGPAPAPDGSAVGGAPEASAATAVPSEEQATPQASAPAGTPPPVPAPEPVPFGFTADERRISVPGATRVGEELRIPVDAWQRYIQPNLRDQRAVQRQLGQLQHENRTLRTRLETPERTRGDALWDRLLALGKDPQQLAALFEKYEVEWPRLQAEAERDYYRQQAEQGHAAQREQAEAADVQALATQLRQGTTAWAQYYAGLDEFKGADGKPLLDPAKLDQELWRLRHDLWSLAEADIPEWNVRQGQYAMDHEAVRQYVSERVEERRATQQHVQEAAKAAAVNQAALQPSPAPATVKAKGSPVASGAQASPTSRQEWETRMARLAGLDVD